MVRGLNGSVESFWPEGVMDMPYDLHLTLNYALSVIGWYENLPEEEQPPRHIWWSEEKLAKWFKEVKEARDAGTSPAGGRSSYDAADDVPMTDNELAAEYREQMLG
jgi:hypothetical protein